LCAEMMKDPETMKVLTNPDNLRALGDCPDLIEQDFMSPDFEPPDIGGDGFDAPDLEADIDGDMEGDLEGGDDDDGGLMDQIQEQKEMNDEDMDGGDDGGKDDGGKDDDGAKDRKAPKDKKKDKEKDKKKDADAEASSDEAKGFLKAGFQVLGGQIFGELNPMGDIMGGAEDLDIGDAGDVDVGGDAGGLDPSSLTDAAGDAGVDPSSAGDAAGGGDGGVAGAAGGGLLAAAAANMQPDALQDRFEIDQEGLLETAKEQGQEQMAERAAEGGDSADKGTDKDGKRGPGDEEEPKKKGFGIGTFISGVTTSVLQDTFISGVVDEDHMGYVEGFQEAMDEQAAEEEDAAKEKTKDGSRAVGEDGQPIEEEASGGRFAFITKATNAVASVIQDELIGNVATEIVGEDNVDDFLGEVEGIQEETAGDDEEEDGGKGDDGGDRDGEKDGTKDGGKSGDEKGKKGGNSGAGGGGVEGEQS